MTEETAKKASKLFKEKSQLLDDLSKITDQSTKSTNLYDILYDNYYYFVLGYDFTGGVIFW